MASSDQNHQSSTATPALPLDSSSDLPPISALFLIDFDVRAGYTIAWKRADSGVEIEGFVEYKSLPSGLHTVSNDLIYFVHDVGHAGLSAFINEPCEEEEARHARMIAVGVLVPLGYGRLGRAWRHADGLKRMATLLAKDRKHMATLEEYWEAHKSPKGNEARQQLSGETPLNSPSITFSAPAASGRKTHGRNRSMSDGAALGHQKLSPYHPAWSLTRLLDRFGPLIFPIYRAALLRKRILISCQAPVHEICDYVYNISVLSNIPLSVTDVLPTSAPTSHLHPLFSIGVHDIPFLMEDLRFRRQNNDSDDDETAVEDSNSGWVACTTDSILAMKENLWDMLITIPPCNSARAKEKVWPTVECPRGHVVKATQRDFRRFQALRAGLNTFSAGAEASPAARDPHLHSADLHPSSRNPDGSPEESLEKIVEPVSWSALAYNGFMWWASAGEQLRSEKQEEQSRDAALLADLSPFSPSMAAPPSRPSIDASANSLTSLIPSSQREEPLPHGEARVELAIIAYFHRLTTQILSVLADVYEAAEETYADEDSIQNATPPYAMTSSSQHSRNSSLGRAEEDRLLHRNSRHMLSLQDKDDEEDEEVKISSRHIEMMGLDVWSGSDAFFLQGLMKYYFERRARIESKGVEVCGVRVC